MELNQRLFVTVEEFKWSPFDRVLCALRRYRDPCQNMVVSHTMVYYYTCPWVLVQPLVKTVFLLTCSTEMRRLFMYNKAEMLAILYYDMLLPELFARALLSPASLCRDTSGLQFSQVRSDLPQFCFLQKPHVPDGKRWRCLLFGKLRKACAISAADGSVPVSLKMKGWLLHTVAECPVYCGDARSGTLLLLSWKTVNESGH